MTIDNTPSGIIEKFDLKSSDAMRNGLGAEIPGSVVIDAGSFIYPDNGKEPGFWLIRHNSITGSETQHWLSHDAIRAFQSVKLD